MGPSEGEVEDGGAVHGRRFGQRQRRRTLEQAVVEVQGQAVAAQEPDRRTVLGAVQAVERNTSASAC